MNKKLDNKIILITGGGSGIGRATAIAAAAEGATVVVADRNKDGGLETLEELKSVSPASYFQYVDVADESSVIAMINNVINQFGQLDGAFNNAGIEFVAKPIQDLSLEEWQRAVSINQTGVFLSLKYEIQAMLKQGSGSIVNTSSGCGQVAIPVAAEYVSTKHAVVGLTKAAAADMGPLGIRVNAVLPGSVNTPMINRLLGEDSEFSEAAASNRNRHLMKRYGEPQEIAAAVIWLLSDAASFVTGACVPVDGGYLAN